MENDIEIEGMRLHYEVSGPENGAPVLLMHGWGCDHTTVRSIANAINNEMRVYNVDLPGHGATPEPDSAWGVDEYTRLMEAFTARLGIFDPVLIGHSFGGRISILMASRNPISRVVLVDAAGIKPHRPLKYYIKIYSFKTAKKILPVILGKKTGGKLIDTWRGKTGSADYRNSSPVMRAVMSRCVNQDLTDRLPLIKARHYSYGARKTKPHRWLMPDLWKRVFRMQVWSAGKVADIIHSLTIRGDSALSCVISLFRLHDKTTTKQFQ